MIQTLPLELFKLPKLNLHKYEKGQLISVHDIIAVAYKKSQIRIAWVKQILPANMVQGIYFVKNAKSPLKYTLAADFSEILLSSIIAVGIEMRPYWKSKDPGQQRWILNNQPSTLKQMKLKGKDELDKTMEDKRYSKPTFQENQRIFKLPTLLDDDQIALNIWDLAAVMLNPDQN